MKTLTSPIFKKQDEKGNTIVYIPNRVQEYNRKPLNQAHFREIPENEYELIGKLAFYSTEKGMKRISTIIAVYNNERQRMSTLLTYGYESGIIEYNEK